MKLKAYAPTGARVRKTFECTLGTQDVSYFTIASSGRVSFENGDDFENWDAETVGHNGTPIFRDDDGALWPLQALTLKDRTGAIVREGQDMEPLAEPSTDLAFTLGFNATAVMGRRTNLTEETWRTLVHRQGWDAASQAQVLEKFIDQMGLWGVLAASAAQQAEETNRADA